VSEQDRFDHELRGWLRGAAARRAPDYLVPMAMAAVHGTRQRRAMPFSYPVSWFALAGVATVAMVIVAVAVLAPPVAPPAVGSPPAIGSASSSSQSRPSVPAQAPTPLDLPSFTAGQVADAKVAWTGLSWHQLANDDPLASVRKIVRWSGGYVAVGAYQSAGAGTPVWTSSDGLHFDPATIMQRAVVLDVAEANRKLVALTVPADNVTCSLFSACSGSIDPIGTYMSTDGVSWKFAEGPNLSSTQVVTTSLVAAAAPAGLLVGTTDGQVAAALLSDGSAWSLVSGGFPEGFELGGLWARPDGYAAVGTVASGPTDDPDFTATTLWSTDGRDWSITSQPEVSRADFVLAASEHGPVSRFGSLVAGRDGAIAVSHEGGVPGITSWWHSTDGRSWQKVADFLPLGPALRDDGSSSGVPDGDIASDGSRMVALRLGDKQAGWTSFDGSTWTSVTLDAPPAQEREMLVLPSGVLVFDGESTWFGEATS
jgi:hypothetical protein